MAKQLARQRVGVQRRKKPPKVVRKLLLAAEQILDEVIDDPGKFIDKAERVAEHAARGVDRFVEEYEKNPEKARRETRDFIVGKIAKFGKKKLRSAR